MIDRLLDAWQHLVDREIPQNIAAAAFFLALCWLWFFHGIGIPSPYELFIP